MASPVMALAIDRVRMLASSATTLAAEITTARYIIVIGYVVLLWESIINFQDEVQLWTTGLSLAKLAFFLNHAASLGLLTFLLRAFSGIGITEPSYDCVTATTAGLAAGVISLGIGNYLVILQVWQMYQQRALVRLALTVGWAMSFFATLAIACTVIDQIPPMVISVPGFNVCGLSSVPKLVRFIWLSPIVFEILVFVFLCWNAYGRPERSTDSLSKTLERDGLIYFFSLSLLRVGNFVITTVAPTAIVGAGSCVIWEMTTVAFNRLILNQALPLPAIDNKPRNDAFMFMDLERCNSELSTINLLREEEFKTVEASESKRPHHDVWASLPEPARKRRWNMF